MIVEGAFVRVHFPTSESPRKPGLLHICYCLAVRPPLALVAYSTSAPWPAGIPLPFGVRPFTRGEALGLGQQRAFRLHLTRQARIQLNREWLPDWDSWDQGVVAVAPVRLRQELYEIALELERRYPETVERSGA